MNDSWLVFWARKLNANPELCGPVRGMTMTTAEFELQIRAAFQSGYEASKSDKSIFEQVFGR